MNQISSTRFHGEKAKGEKIVKLRLRVRNNLEELKLNSNQFLARFLIHTNWSVSAAEKMLQKYIRKNKKLDLKLKSGEEYPSEFYEIFKVYFGGSDYENRPVLLIPEVNKVDGGSICRLLDQLDEKNSSLLSQFLMEKFLKTENLVLERNVESGVVIVDVSNVTFMQYLHKKTIDFFVQTIKKLEGHSPGIIGKVIIVNAPRVIKPLIKMLKQVVNFSTEFIILDSDWKSQGLLKQHVPTESLSVHFGGTKVNLNLLD